MIDTTKTTVSMGLSRDSAGRVSLSISDEHSGERILEVTMTLKELGLLMTSLHGVKGRAEVNNNQVIAKKRITKHVQCKRILGNKKAQKDEVLKHFFTNFDDSWTIQSDGTTSQQHGEFHQYTVKSYEDVDDPFEVERYY